MSEFIAIADKATLDEIKTMSERIYNALGRREIYTASRDADFHSSDWLLNGLSSVQTALEMLAAFNAREANASSGSSSSANPFGWHGTRFRIKPASRVLLKSLKFWMNVTVNARIVYDNQIIWEGLPSEMSVWVDLNLVLDNPTASDKWLYIEQQSSSYYTSSGGWPASNVVWDNALEWLGGYGSRTDGTNTVGNTWPNGPLGIYGIRVQCFNHTTSGVATLELKPSRSLWDYVNYKRDALSTNAAVIVDVLRADNDAVLVSNALPDDMRSLQFIAGHIPIKIRVTMTRTNTTIETPRLRSLSLAWLK